MVAVHENEKVDVALTTEQSAKKSMAVTLTLALAAISVVLTAGLGGTTIGMLAMELEKWEKCDEPGYHDPITGKANISKMVGLLQRHGVHQSDMDTYLNSFSAGPTPINVSGKATKVGAPFNTPTHGVAPIMNSTNGRRLSTLGNLVTIGKMVGQVWSLVQANAQVSDSNWVGAVPEAYKTTWMSITGWQAYSVKPWGDNTPNCKSGWGETYADWSLSWEGNGNYIENAKVLASATAAWGMNVGVSAQASTAPVNVGTEDNPIAQLQFTIIFTSQGGWASKYTLSIIVTFDATGNYGVTTKTGSFC